MLLIKLLGKLLQVLRSGESPNLIAGGIAAGFVLGLSPFMTLQGFAIVVIALISAINLSSMGFATLLFTVVAALLDPLFHRLGYFLLTGVPALTSVWTTLYRLPIAPLTRFNNTVVMGSTLIGLLFAVPVFFAARYGVIQYRQRWAARFEQSKLIRLIKGSALYKWYLKIQNMTEFER